MANLEQAIATQLANIEKRSGKSLTELTAALQASGLLKHGEQIAFLKQEFSLGHGDANMLAHHARALSVPATDDPLDAIYGAAKAALRPLHEALMAQIQGFGPFEIAPKKTYLSLRRKKQFAMIGPATKAQIEIGLNVKDLTTHTRLKALPAGGMCNYTVRLSAAGEIDAELLGWLRRAFDSAG